MRAMLAIAATLLLAPPLSGSAEAVSVRDIVELSKAGLGDEVLLALIEVDGTIFTMDAALIRSLKDEGVSERVIEAMIRSGRPSRRPEPERASVQPYEPAPPPPQVIVIEHREAPRREIVTVPVYVPVPTVSSPRRRHADAGPTTIRTGFGVVTVPAARSEPAPARPVYWGWGGKLRPDAWKPAGHREEPKKGDGKNRQ